MCFFCPGHLVSPSGQTGSWDHLLLLTWSTCSVKGAIKKKVTAPEAIMYLQGAEGLLINTSDCVEICPFKIR